MLDQDIFVDFVADYVASGDSRILSEFVPPDRGCGENYM